MERAKCSVCLETSPYRFLSAYWAWRWPTGDRRAYKQLLDSKCAGYVVAIMKGMRDEDMGCWHCHGELAVKDAMYLWATIYVPGQERFDGALGVHPNCFAQMEGQFMRGAERLADRKVGAGGPPPPTRDDPWGGWVLPTP